MKYLSHTLATLRGTLLFTITLYAATPVRQAALAPSASIALTWG